jgi:outer membrane protein OmpA-like peptidoglycan-associated protein
VYDDATARWLPLVNLGIPVNSAGDETGFSLTADGLKAFLSSDRKSGFGMRDLYSAYFKEQVREQLTLSVPVTFIQLASVPNDTLKPISPDPAPVVREYVVSDLWFEPNDYVITPQNIKKLEVLANLLLIYPTLTLDLICHDVSTGPKSYDLFFSVKKSEQVAQYLMRKGISADRMYVKGCGSYYPLAQNADATVSNPGVDRLNRRIELHVYGAEAQPVSIVLDEPAIPEGLRDARGARFDRIQDQMVYRVQIASVGQLLQHNIFDDYSDVMVEYESDRRRYRYLIGMESQFKNAFALRDELRTKGFNDAFVVVYYKGRQLTRPEILQYSEEFPDLLNFMQ